MHGHIGERPGFNAATAIAGEDCDGLVDQGYVERVVSVGNCLPVSRYRIWPTVEERGFSGIRSVFGPIPVRLIAGVTALVTKSLLVGPSEVAVPGEKVALCAILT